MQFLRHHSYLESHTRQRAAGRRMKILAIEHELPDVSGRQFTEALLQMEARRVWELHQAGIIRELYFRADRDEAVLVLECVSVDAARGALDTLPLVCEKLIEFELIPLLAYPGFARLFAAEHSSQ